MEKTSKIIEFEKEINFHLNEIEKVKTNIVVLKRTRKYGICICSECNKEFEKPKSEIARNYMLDRLNFCSRTCVGKHNVKNFGDKSWVFDNTVKNKRYGDKYTKFRYHYRNLLKRTKEVNITIDDLIEQWDKQNGICMFSGANLILSTYTKIEKNPIYCASLDRIDSKLGYIKGNIRWVSRAINWMKNEMDDSQVWELCHLISDNITKK